MDPVSIIGAATTLLNAVGLSDWLKRKFAGKPSEAAAGAIVDTVVAAAGATDWREANRMIAADGDDVAQPTRQPATRGPHRARAADDPARHQPQPG